MESDHLRLAGLFCGNIIVIRRSDNGKFAGRFIDWMGTKKGYLWAIFVWSLGACLHALCGWATEETLGIHNAEEMLSATGAVASTIAITSVYYFID